jgi:hypothetical protein
MNTKKCVCVNLSYCDTDGDVKRVSAARFKSCLDEIRALAIASREESGNIETKASMFSVDGGNYNHKISINTTIIITILVKSFTSTSVRRLG